MHRFFQEWNTARLARSFWVVLAAASLFAASPPHSSAQDAFSEPVGSYQLTLLGNSDTYVSIPFTRAPAFVGQVQSAVGNVITVQGSPNWTASQFVYASGSQPNTYYAFLASGQREGFRFTITNNAANTLSVDLGDSDLSNIVVGDEIRVIPFWIFGTAFPNGEGVHESPTAANRDTEVLISNHDGVGIDLSASRIYYF